MARSVSDRRRAFLLGGVLAAVAVGGLLRLRMLSAPLWGDEATTVGIAGHSLGSIPGLLRDDGSPPLYYVLLHFWMAVFGRGAVSGHLLSALFGIALVPVAAWAGWLLGGRRVALFSAALAATCPFVTVYSDEIRMYTLMVVLSVVASTSIVRALQSRRAGWWVASGASVAALMYTHNWGLYFACGAVAGVCVGLLLRPSARSGKGVWLAALTTVVLFAPWLPTLWYQAHHTAAPWLLAPTVHSAADDVRNVLLGGRGTRYELVGFAVAAAGLGAVWQFRARRRWEALEAPLIMGTIIVVTLAASFAVSLHSPSWIWRYLAPVVGPFLLLVALLAARARLVGLVAVLVVVGVWVTGSTTVVGSATVPIGTAKLEKSNARQLVSALGSLPARSVVLVQSDMAPVISYYLPAARYASVEGVDLDPSVFNWSDVVHRLDSTDVAARVEPILAGIPRGSDLVVITTAGLSPNPFSLAVERTLRALEGVLASQRGQFRAVRMIDPGLGLYEQFSAVVYTRWT